MHIRRGQYGLGLIGFIFVLALIGFVALVTIKVVPLYLNQMTLKRDLNEVATQVNTSGSEIDIGELRRDVEKRFDIDYITQLEAKDIKVERTESGMTMGYDYEARANLFSNVFVVIHFKESIPLRVRVNG
ncbi:MAG TPA: DUF4845 domain-containing protein [Nevskia sp.]|nr:DUF4845 domain-containing protein [Nevskia sp.]